MNSRTRSPEPPRHGLLRTQWSVVRVGQRQKPSWCLAVRIRLRNPPCFAARAHLPRVEPRRIQDLPARRCRRPTPVGERVHSRNGRTAPRASRCHGAATPSAWAASTAAACGSRLAGRAPAAPPRLPSPRRRPVRNARRDDDGDGGRLIALRYSVSVALNIQWMPNRSTSMPKRAPQNVSCSGSATVPPSDSAAKCRSTSARPSYWRQTEMLPPARDRRAGLAVADQQRAAAGLEMRVHHVVGVLGRDVAARRVREAREPARPSRRAPSRRTRSHPTPCR